MPIYEYCCNKCGSDFEELVFGNDTPTCPHCGSCKTEKLMSRCARCSGGRGGDDYAGSCPGSAPSGGGCAGCSGGNCASCGR